MEILNTDVNVKTLDLKFDVKGNKKQLECAKAWNDDNICEICFSGSKGCGKTWCGISLIFGDAFLYPNTKYYIARYGMVNLNRYTSNSIYNLFNYWNISDNYYKFDKKRNIWKLNNGSEVHYIDIKYIPSDPNYERFNLYKFKSGVIDDASSIGLYVKNNYGEHYIEKYSKKIERNLLNKLYSITNNKILYLCKTAKNFLYIDFYLKYKENKLRDDRRFIQSSYTDNKTISYECYDVLLDRMSEKDIEVLLKVNWDYKNKENNTGKL